ncbi:hypothetical protein ACH5RR_009641 [Cinchona calisaya]|uniref:F-box domain-containing protein n=1 Tax=Cinchona calisaya TaxID=153742 RepID=A0ABD3AF96_9GENT
MTSPPASESKRSKTVSYSIQDLPPEIVFNILLCLPVDILYNVTKYVCRAWYNIMSSPNFIDAHRLRSDTDGLIQIEKQICSAPYLKLAAKGDKDDGVPETTKIPFLDCPGLVMSSCNGLLLYENLSNYYIANPVTNEIVTLPPPPEKLFWFTWPLNFGYASSSKRHKVVDWDVDQRMNLQYFCKILTVGVDKAWRCLTSPNESLKIEKFPPLLFRNRVLSSEGFLHWTYHAFVITLDLERETFYFHGLPNYSDKKNTRFLETGRLLSLSEFKVNYSWEIWFLTNVQTTGGWTRQATIDLGPQLRCNLFPQAYRIEPVGWLKNGEVAILHQILSYDDKGSPLDDDKGSPLGNCFTCNLKTGALNSFRLDEFIHCRMFTPHVNTLVSMKFLLSSAAPPFLS